MIDTAVILAGGLGTRLRSVVNDRPKVLAPVNGKPFITFLLDQIAQTGFKVAVLCTGYLGEQVKAALGDSYGPLQLIYSQETEPWGTGGAVRLASSLITTDPVLVMNGDSYCEADLLAFYRQHQAAKSRVSLLLIHLADTRRYGRVEINKDNHISRFEEKGENSAGGWINTGIYLLTHPFILSIPTGRAVSLEQEMFPNRISQGLYGFSAVSVNGVPQFLDIGIPEDYETAESFFRARI